MPMTQKGSINRDCHIAAAVLVTEDVSEVVLFGGGRDLTSFTTLSETTILRLGKLWPTSNLCHSNFGQQSTSVR